MALPTVKDLCDTLDIGIDYRKPHHGTACFLNMADDLNQPCQIMQTKGNLAECCDNLAPSVSPAI